MGGVEADPDQKDTALTISKPSVAVSIPCNDQS
jgi:hypothetical protein